MRASRPYANPYAAGVGLGLVLLASYVLAGRGIGASGAFATVVAGATHVVAPQAVMDNPYFAERLAAGGLLGDWLVVEMLGLLVGAAASAALAGRLRLAVDAGPRTGVRGRLGGAATGGLVMGIGAVLARGCTSGLALTGGALLGVGAWIFVGAAFAAGYVTMFVVRRQWT
jgi:uncharacterized membrane protein YedE/YeeE